MAAVAERSNYRVGIKGHPITVLIDGEGKEHYSREMHEVTEDRKTKMRPRLDYHAQLRDFAIIEAVSVGDAKEIFSKKFGVVDTSGKNWIVEPIAGPAKPNLKRGPGRPRKGE